MKKALVVFLLALGLIPALPLYADSSFSTQSFNNYAFEDNYVFGIQVSHRRHASGSLDMTIKGPAAASTGTSLYKYGDSLQVTKTINEDNSDSWFDVWFDNNGYSIDSTNGGKDNGTQTVTIPNGARTLHLRFRSQFSEWFGYQTDDTKDFSLVPDNTGMSFTLTASPTTWGKGPATFGLSAISDNNDIGTAGAGVDNGAWKYSTDNGTTWVTYSPNYTYTYLFGFIPIITGVSYPNVTLSGTGQIYLRVRGSDAFGNTTENTATLWVDNTPPSISATVPAYASSSLLISQVDFSDVQSGPNQSSFQAAFDSAAAQNITLSGASFSLDVPAGFTEGTHTLTLSGSDAAGNSTTKTYSFTVDRTPPVLQFQLPPSRDSMTSSSFSFSDSLSTADTSTLVYWFDQELAPAAPTALPFDGMGFTVPTSALAEGSHTMYVQGADSAGNIAKAGAPFSVDRSGPVVSVQVPPFAGTTLTVGSVSFIDVSPVSSTQTWWLDSPTQPAGAGTFTVSGGSFSLALSSLLPEATHTLYLAVVDALGNQTVKSYDFTIDRTPPSLAFTVPSYSDSSLAVSGVSFSDAVSGVDEASLVYWFDQTSAPSNPTPLTVSAGSATVTVPSNFAEASHTLYLRGSNHAGLATKVSHSFVLDKTAPTLTATTYLATTPHFVKNSLVVSGIAYSDASSGVVGLGSYFDSVSGSANPITLSGGSLTISVSGLTEGGHTLILQGADTAGNPASLSLPFSIDRTPPSLSANVPGSANSALAVTNLAFADGSGSGPVTSSLVWWIDSGAHTAFTPAGGNFSVPVSSSLTEGTHSLFLSGADGVGNTVTSSAYAFKVDRTPPTLSGVLDAVVNSTLNGSSFAFSDGSGSGSLVSSLVWKIDSGNFASLTVNSGSFSIPVSSSISVGNHVLTLQGQDSAGNLGQLTWTFQVDRTAPALTDLGLAEAGRAVGAADYLHGETVVLTPVWTDATDVQFRSVVKLAGLAPQNESDWGTATWTDAGQSLGMTSLFTVPLSYLYVQARDAAGNLSVITERVVRLDNGAPGVTTIRSSTHPRAFSVTDAVAQTTALFRLSVSSTGPGGLKEFQWKFFQSATQPDPDSSALVSGTTDDDVSLADLHDNKAQEFDWLAARAIGGNGKNGDWTLFPFRVDTAPPADLTVTSPTHPLESTAYPGTQASFVWNQPADFTGVKSYYYKQYSLGVNDSWAKPTQKDATWTAIGQTSLVVAGLSESGQVGLAVAAEDWSGNVVYAYHLARYDNVKPVWNPADGRTFSVVADYAHRSVTVNWRTATDDVSTSATGLIYGVHVAELVTGVETARWQYLSVLPSSGQTIFTGLNQGQSYLVTVALEDGAGNRQEYPVAVQLADPSQPIPPIPAYTVDYNQTWEGLSVWGKTTYTGVSISGQTANLSLTGTPLSTSPVSSSVALPTVSPVSPRLSVPDSASSTLSASWSANGISGTVQGISLSRASGLTLTSLAVSLPLKTASGQPAASIGFPTVHVGPAPVFSLSSGVTTLPAGLTMTTTQGWKLTGLSAAALEATGWKLSGTSQVTPPNSAVRVTSDAGALVAATLTLDSGAYFEGQVLRRGVVQVPVGGVFVTAGGLTIQLVHAVVQGDRIDIAQGYAVVAGLSSSTALELDDISVDTAGRLWAGSAYTSKLTGTIATGYGTLTADSNAFVISGNLLVLSQAVLSRADGSSVSLQSVSVDSAQLGGAGATFVGSFDKVYNGIAIHGTAGHLVSGVRVFDTAAMDLPAFGLTGLALTGLGVALADDAVVLPGTVSQTVSLTTGYGTGKLSASGLTFSAAGASATLTATLPAAWGNATLPLGKRSLAADGTVGSDPGTTYASVTYLGFTLKPLSIDITYEGLVFNSLQLTGYAPFSGVSPSFEGMTIKNTGNVVHNGVSGNVVAHSGTWNLSFDELDLGASLTGLPTVDLPAALGGKPFPLGTTTLLSAGTFTTQPRTTGVDLDVFGWSTSSASLAIEGSNFRLLGVTVLMPGLLQGQDVAVGSLLVSQAGDLLATDSTAQAAFRGVNGFRVQATGVHFDPRGLAMGGQVFLPESLGGAAVNFPAGSIYLEPDGAVLAQADGVALSLQYASFPLTATKVILDRSGLTISGAQAIPLGLVAISLPDFTVYSTGELAVGGESLSQGQFDLPGGVHVEYSDVRFSDEGLHLSASVQLPSTWGGTSLDFDDLMVGSDGHVQASAALHHLVLPLDTLGINISVDSLRLNSSGFLLDGVEFELTKGDLANQSLRIDSARIDYSGNLDLYGFSFAPIDVFGYQVTLTGLQIGPAGLGLSGGIRLPDTLPIPELQGLYLSLNKFKVGLDGTIQDFEVSINQGLTLTVFDSWTLGIQGLTINKNILTITQATLDLPAQFSLPQLSVQGMSLNLQTGAITWGKISVAGATYQWNGLTFRLSTLSITPSDGLMFGGAVDIPEKTQDGMVFPPLLQNRTLQVETFQILPTGLPGAVSVTLKGLTGPLFDDNVLLSNADFHLENQNGALVFGFTGSVKLGASFLPGLAGLTLQIHSLLIDVTHASLSALDVDATAGLGVLPLPGGLSYEAHSLRLTKTGDTSFEVGTTGDFLTGAAFPGILANRRIPVTAFRMDSTGKLLDLAANLNLPGQNPLLGGLSLNDAVFGVNYSGGSMAYSASGHIQFSTGFMDGLSGLVLDVNHLVWDGAGTLQTLDVGTHWSGSRPFFGSAAIENGAISLSAAGSQAWTVGIQGTLRLPATGLPDGLAGLGLNIQSLKFKTDGTIQDVAIYADTLNLDLFGVAKLQGGHIGFSRHDAHSLEIGLSGKILLPNSLPDGLKGQSVNIQDFRFTTAGQVLAMNASIPLGPISLFSGITMTGANVGFSLDGVSLTNAKVSIPQTLLEGLPDSFLIQRVVVGWDGKLKDLAGGIGHALVKIGGFSTDITNLAVSTTGISLEKAVLTLPPNLGNQQFLLLNAGFDTSGHFTGSVGVDEIKQDIAGFGLSLKSLSFDVNAHTIRVAVAHIQTPKIGSLNANIDLNGVTIGNGGVSLGGLGFSLPDYDYGGIGFRAVHVSFSVTGNTFDISGSGQGTLPGLGTLDASLAFTNISNVYPIGLKSAYFQYTLSAGIPLGTTGLYLNKIRGGFAYGPPNELPGDLRPLFNQLGPRLQLGVGVNTALGDKVLQMDANFWIDLKNASWAFDGTATVLSGFASGRLGAGYGNNIFYGTFQFQLRFVEGGVRVWIFPYQGRTVMSGEGNLTFILRNGSLFHWGAEWWHPEVNIPGGDVGFGGISAEFGQFNQGVGVKGSVSVPCWGPVGVYVDSGGMHFNISDYSLIKPAGY